MSHCKKDCCEEKSRVYVVRGGDGPTGPEGPPGESIVGPTGPPGESAFSSCRYVLWVDNSPRAPSAFARIDWAPDTIIDNEDWLYTVTKPVPDDDDPVGPNPPEPVPPGPIPPLYVWDNAVASVGYRFGMFHTVAPDGEYALDEFYRINAGCNLADGDVFERLAGTGQGIDRYVFRLTSAAGGHFLISQELFVFGLSETVTISFNRLQGVLVAVPSVGDPSTYHWNFDLTRNDFVEAMYVPVGHGHSIQLYLPPGSNVLFYTGARALAVDEQFGLPFVGLQGMKFTVTRQS